MIDCHSHILPCIDDGSRSMQESKDILRKMKDVGVQTVWATPHFYPNHNLEEFLVKRDKAYEALVESLGEEAGELPSIRRGAEVLLSVDTPNLQDLHQLCIEGTRYILIELPYANWSEWVYDTLYKIRAKHKLIPIIAHIERYAPMQTSIDKINRLLEMDLMTQMNVYSLMGKHKSLALRMVKNNMIHLLGSDTHRLKSMTPVNEGYEFIGKKMGEAVANRMINHAEAVLKDQKVDK